MHKLLRKLQYNLIVFSSNFFYNLFVCFKVSNKSGYSQLQEHNVKVNLFLKVWDKSRQRISPLRELIWCNKATKATKKGDFDFLEFVKVFSELSDESAGICASTLVQFECKWKFCCCKKLHPFTLITELLHTNNHTWAFCIQTIWSHHWTAYKQGYKESFTLISVFLTKIARCLIMNNYNLHPELIWMESFTWVLIFLKIHDSSILHDIAREK